MSERKRRRGFPGGLVDATRVPEEERVLDVGELVRKDPVPAGQPMPAELRRMLDASTLARYVESRDEPDIRVTRRSVGDGPSGRLWEVAMDAGERALLNGCPGVGQSVVDPDDLRKFESGPRSAAGFRPPWQRLEFLPRLHPQRQFVAEVDPPRHAIELAPPQGQPVRDYTGEGWVVGWPWTCIGKVEGGYTTDYSRVIKSGTGALVGRNLVLTAAHVAMWDPGPGQWWMRFRPGFDILLPNLGSSFVEQFRGPGPQSTPNPNDFVVCKLYQPLGDALGYFGYGWSSDDGFYENQRWMSAGYPAYKYGGQRLISEYDIGVRDVDHYGDGREIEINLNAFFLNGGWSGGPLWGWFPGDDPRVVGVCSGYEMDDYDPARTVFAGGGPMVSYARSARQDWS